MSKLRWIEFGAAFVLVVVLAVLGMNWAQQRRVRAELQACHNNLRAWHTVFRMYAAESPGNRYPPMLVGDDLSPQAREIHARRPELVTHDRFVPSPRGDAIYPDYMTDHAMLFCPSATVLDLPSFNGLIDGSPQGDDLFSPSYGYYGYATPELDDWLILVGSMAHAPHEDVADLRTWIDSAIPVEADHFAEHIDPYLRQELGKYSASMVFEPRHPRFEPSRHSSFHRLRPGVENQLGFGTTLAESDVPVFWGLCVAPQPNMLVFNHMPGGSNVLYLDGHVEFVPFRSKFPVEYEVAVMNTSSPWMSQALTPWLSHNVH